jgi:hypothetical protein
LTRRPAGSPESDRDTITCLLGREPAGAFVVVVRRPDGTPSVIENEPLLFDGTPMPTRFWLVDPELRAEVSRLESTGGVHQAELAVDALALADAHERYAAERDARIPPGYAGPRPSGGVGGTRQGVKCLHAHFAWWLAGGEDPVGAWVAGKLEASGVSLGPRAPRGPGAEPDGSPLVVSPGVVLDEVDEPGP